MKSYRDYLWSGSINKLLLLLLISTLNACGGGGGSESGANNQAADTAPPKTPGLSASQITALNVSSYSFEIFSAELNTTYRYSFTDQKGRAVSGDGKVTSNFAREAPEGGLIADITVSNINLINLADGSIRFELYLVDNAGNQSERVISSFLTKSITIPSQVILSGRISYDFVPHDNLGSGLNYANTSTKPARGVEVVLLDQSDSQIDSTVTNNNGEYSFSVAPIINVRVRAKARLLSNTGASWDFSVTDNTNNNALYVLQGAQLNTGVTDITNNLHASSGWGGSEYTQTRAAAPFAILDTIYNAITIIINETPTVVLPTAEIRWSTLNSTADGDLTQGEIGTSFYSSSDNSIYILGAADNDTDEYDRHVIAHEWVHYFEDTLSRSDSIGGPHTDGDRLDMRTAFSEGLGNALSAIITNSPTYKDSAGDDQSTGFTLNIENNSISNAGWYSEGSVQSIIYDIYDSNDDGVDSISNGFNSLYSTLTSGSYINAVQFTSIHLFLSELKSQFSSLNSSIDTLASAQSMVINDAYGAGETNDAGVTSVLPIYRPVIIGGPATNICSLDDFGTSNKLANYNYVMLTVSISGNYTIIASRNLGLVSADPDFYLWRAGQLIASAQSTVINSETLNISLNAGNYLIEVSEYANVTGVNSGDVCFNIEVN